MTKENKTTLQDNNLLEELKKILNDYNLLKNEKTKVNNYFKQENKINIIQEVNEKCLKLFENRNKTGFLQLVKHDFYRYYLKKFYEKNHVFIKEEDNNKIFILFENEDSLKACYDFKKYALKTIEDNKQKQKEKKNNLLNKNIKDFSLLKYSKEELQAIILQAQKQVKELNK